MAKRGGARNASMASSAHEGLSDTPSETKPNARGKGKKGNVKSATTNGRRKADETPQKGSNKRTKGNSGQSNVDPNLENQDSEEEEEVKQDQPDSNKKMTDEEKRKNFLERNRYVVPTVLPTILTFPGWLLLSADSARSSGLQISRLKWRSSAVRMMLLAHRSLNCGRRLST